MVCKCVCLCLINIHSLGCCRFLFHNSGHFAEVKSSTGILKTLWHFLCPIVPSTSFLLSWLITIIRVHEPLALLYSDSFINGHMYKKFVRTWSNWHRYTAEIWMFWVVRTLPFLCDAQSVIFQTAVPGWSGCGEGGGVVWGHWENTRHCNGSQVFTQDHWDTFVGFSL